MVAVKETPGNVCWKSFIEKQSSCYGQAQNFTNNYPDFYVLFPFQKYYSSHIPTQMTSHLIWYIDL